MVAEFNEALKESVAETSDEMMDKYFSGESFTYAEMIQGLRQGVRELSMFPVLFGSAINCIGSLMLMDYIVDLLPNPMEGNHHKATMQNGETEDFVVSPGGVPTAYVFKTISDQYGKYSMIKVLSGVITSDLPLVNARTGAAEKLGRLYKMCVYDAVSQDLLPENILCVPVQNIMPELHVLSTAQICRGLPSSDSSDPHSSLQNTDMS